MTEKQTPPPSNHGVILTVMHPDFAQNDDGQREGCLEGMRKGHHYVSLAAGLETPFPEFKSDDRGIHLWLPYADGGPKMAERAAAGFMMYIGRAVVAANVPSAKEPMPCYDVTVKRGEKWSE